MKIKANAKKLKPAQGTFLIKPTIYFSDDGIYEPIDVPYASLR